MNAGGDPFGPVTSGSLTMDCEYKSICSCRVPMAFLDICQPQSSWEGLPTPKLSRFDREVKNFPAGVDAAEVLHNHFKELLMNPLWSQECLSQSGIKHEALIYTKVAKFSGAGCYTVIAGLILQRILADDNIKYTRVGRNLMQPGYCEVEPAAWPIQTFTIV
jgi:hypothetical protein